VLDRVISKQRSFKAFLVDEIVDAVEDIFAVMTPSFMKQDEAK